MKLTRQFYDSLNSWISFIESLTASKMITSDLESYFSDLDRPFFIQISQSYYFGGFSLFAIQCFQHCLNIKYTI